MLALVAAAASVPALPSHAGAQATGTDGYAPCEAGQNIDVLVMMDASGSLNAPSSGTGLPLVRLVRSIGRTGGC